MSIYSLLDPNDEFLRFKESSVLSIIGPLFLWKFKRNNRGNNQHFVTILQPIDQNNHDI